MNKNSKFATMMATAGSLISMGMLAYRLYKLVKCRQLNKSRERQLDEKIAQSMDCSDPISSY